MGELQLLEDVLVGQRLDGRVARTDRLGGAGRLRPDALLLGSVTARWSATQVRTLCGRHAAPVTSRSSAAPAESHRGHDHHHVPDGVPNSKHADRDSAAVHLELDELIRSVTGAHNALLDLEELTEADLERLRSGYESLGQAAREDLLRGLLDTDARRACVEGARAANS